MHMMHIFSFQHYMSCIRKCKDNRLLQVFTNTVFEVGSLEMETSLEQVSFLFLLCVYVTSDLNFFIFYMENVSH
jgi:hypothetical protein